MGLLDVLSAVAHAIVFAGVGVFMFAVSLLVYPVACAFIQAAPLLGMLVILYHAGYKQFGFKGVGEFIVYLGPVIGAVGGQVFACIMYLVYARHVATIVYNCVFILLYIGAFMLGVFLHKRAEAK